MKRCPYCAEEVQDEAVFCRFCSKKITGIKLRRTVKITILIAIIASLVIYYPSIKRGIGEARIFFNNAVTFLQNLSRDIKKGLSTLETYGKSSTFDKVTNQVEGVKYE